MHFLDEYSILHLNANPKFDESENGLTFTGGYHAIYRASGKSSPIAIPDLSLFIKQGTDGHPIFLPTPKSSDNSHFSLDNMHGLYCLRELYFPKLDLPTYKWYKPHRHTESISKKWIRPDTAAFFGILNKELVWVILGPLIMLIAATISCKKDRGTTSGKILWFQRFCLLSVSKNKFQKILGKIGLSLVNDILEENHGSRPMIDVMQIYFKNENHPMHTLIKDFYSGPK